MTRRRWTALLVAGWAVALLVLAALGGGVVTVPTQRGVDAVRPIVDRAAADVIGAAGPDVAVAVGGYTNRGGCRISPVRSGARFERTVDLFTTPGREAELLDRLARGLRVRYAARHGRDAHPGPGVFGKTGAFVRLAARPDGTATGHVRVRVETGCRPVDRPVATFHTAPVALDRTRLDPLLHAAGAGAVSWRTHRVPCGGGEIRTVSATGKAARARLDDLVRALLPARVLVTEGNLVAARDGVRSIVARVTDGGFVIQSTMDCAS